ncbi:alkaline phosphatase family protein [Pedosphaera parvula]|nr:nucleotide pyrophosphatase/phosphodiesterase family protein [Pedosphaera parvula]
MHRILLKTSGCVLLLLLFGGLVTPVVHAAGQAKHVVVVVWDGMRPDFVSPENTPNLWKLAADGVTFANHHPVYLSATEVNATAIATGGYPGNSGVIANKEYRPEIDVRKMIHMESVDSIRKGDEVTGGHYIHMKTTIEALQQAGLTTAVAGSKPVAVLHDRYERPETAKNRTFFAGNSLPKGFSSERVRIQGAFPSEGATSPTRNDWTTRALIEGMWKDGVPAYTVLWMNEPDWSQHKSGPGSPMAMAAIKNADENLGRVLAALKEKGELERTDIMLVSDHGFSTIGERINLAESLKKGGFKTLTEFKGNPEKDEIMVVSNGGSYLFYVIGHDKGTICQLVEYLQKQAYSGVVFTRNPMPGTFTFAQARLDSPTAPDVLLSMHWTDETNSFGTKGMLTSGVYDYGDRGMHVSLSKYDMHNTLIAAGPDFRRGVVSQLPSGNMDIAPTALWILGVKKPMDGRVLSEGMIGSAAKLKSYEPRRLEASAKVGETTWHQYLNFTEVNGETYLDEGNGWVGSN